jgi:RNA polymerase sigma-70 factor (ECF subfamily)
MTALASLLREDAVFAMPPTPGVTRGRDAIVELWAPALAGPSALGEFLVAPVSVNRQPAAASYARKPGESAFRAVGLDVLRIEGGMIVDIVAFEHTTAFPIFDLLDLPVSQ